MAKAGTAVAVGNTPIKNTAFNNSVSNPRANPIPKINLFFKHDKKNSAMQALSVSFPDMAYCGPPVLLATVGSSVKVLI